MRYMVLVKATAESETGEMPENPDVFEEMNKYGEELVKAGVLPAGEGLHPGSQGSAGALRRQGAPPSRTAWRIESARLIAGLARLVRDVGLAEELAQDALVAALEQWPRDRRPRQPGRVADGDRQAPGDRPHPPPRALERKHDELGRELGPSATAEADLEARSTTTSATTCCASSSPRATRCSRPRRAWR